MKFKYLPIALVHVKLISFFSTLSFSNYSESQDKVGYSKTFENPNILSLSLSLSFSQIPKEERILKFLSVSTPSHTNFSKCQGRTVPKFFMSTKSLSSLNISSFIGQEDLEISETQLPFLSFTRVFPSHNSLFFPKIFPLTKEPIFLSFNFLSLPNFSQSQSEGGSTIFVNPLSVQENLSETI